jgi:hypothetical protein
MKTFREFILECELVEGKVEWDNPKRPLQSGMTPREKNRVMRKRLEVFKGLGSTRGRSFTSSGPSERDYERYGGLTLANQEQSGLKPPKKNLHKFKDDKKGKSARKKYAPQTFRSLKEPKTPKRRGF